jgi:hypothetical protein
MHLREVHLQRLVNICDILGDYIMAINVVLDPERERGDRFIQGILDRHYACLQALDTDYRLVRDSNGEIIDIVQFCRMRFKDGSSLTTELPKPHDRERTSGVNVVLNPDRVKVDRFIQNTINKHHSYIKTFTGDYRVMRDDDKEVCAIVQRYHIFFKSSSDMVDELNAIPEQRYSQ